MEGQEAGSRKDVDEQEALVPTKPIPRLPEDVLRYVFQCMIDYGDENVDDELFKFELVNKEWQRAIRSLYKVLCLKRRRESSFVAPIFTRFNFDVAIKPYPINCKLFLKKLKAVGCAFTTGDRVLKAQVDKIDVYKGLENLDQDVGRRSRGFTNHAGVFDMVYVRSSYQKKDDDNQRGNTFLSLHR